MPFDGIDLGEPNLKALSRVLRDKSLWPDGFQWNYRYSGSCAIGLAEALWGQPGREMTYRVPPEVRTTIFMTLGTQAGLTINSVRPQYVADAIDQWLTTKKTVFHPKPKLTWWDWLFHRL